MFRNVACKLHTHETLYPAQMLSSMLPAHVADQLKQRLYAPKQAGRTELLITIFIIYIYSIYVYIHSQAGRTDAREFIVDASDEAVVLFSEVVDFERQSAQ